MKTCLNLIVIGLASGLSLGGLSARANLEVSAAVNIRAEADFYEPLSAQGAWIEVGSYGRCWRPARVAVAWRPYCYGHWVWTDCGWYWESDEPWGWACYHYGYWIDDPAQGWIWAPGIEWGPAWVSWRVGGGYIGWAPLLPPHARMAVTAAPYVFVEANRFDRPLRPSAVIVNNTTIINQTTVINNVRHETRTIGDLGSRRVVINEGPGVAVVQKATGRQFKAVAIQEATRRTRVPAAAMRGNGGSKEKERSTVSRDAERRSTSERKPAPSGRAGAGPGFPTDDRKEKEQTVRPPSERAAAGPVFKAPPGTDREQPARPESRSAGREERQHGRKQLAPPHGQPPSWTVPPEPAPDAPSDRSQGERHHRDDKDHRNETPR